MRKFLFLVIFSFFTTLSKPVYAQEFEYMSIPESEIKKIADKSFEDIKYIKNVVVEIEEDYINVTGRAGFKILKLPFDMDFNFIDEYKTDKSLENLKVDVLNLKIAGINIANVKKIEEAIESNANFVLQEKFDEYDNIPVYDVAVRKNEIVLTIDALEMYVFLEEKF